jgi:hypothetical protein
MANGVAGAFGFVKVELLQRLVSPARCVDPLDERGHVDLRLARRQIGGACRLRP